MKHKEKRLEYARQYQTMEVVFSEEKKFSVHGSDGFQKYWHAKNFPVENYSTRHSVGVCIMIWSGMFYSSSLKLKLQYVCGCQKAADYVKMLNDLPLTWEGRRLCEEELIFQQYNAAIDNASITKKYLLGQKIRLLDHPACSSDINPT